MNQDLDGKVAVVTGGSRGIGRAIAEAFLERGAQVAISGLHQEGLDAAARALQAGDRLAGIVADVRKPDQAGHLIDDTVRRWGGVDILVNNAGVGLFKEVEALSADEWHRVLDTNLSGVFYCCHAAIPHLKKRGGGWIINISSLAGKNAFAGGAAYCASKAALNAFSESLMQEVRYHDIRVSYVMPGSVATEFSHPSAPGSLSAEASAKAERSADDWRLAAEDVARTVVDLVLHPSRSLPSRVELRPSKPRK